jgi:CubicO group peptidase (beta-lactamase class C family)
MSTALAGHSPAAPTRVHGARLRAVPADAAQRRRGGRHCILAPATVRLMATNHVGTLLGTTGLGFGLGFQTVEQFGAAGLSSERSFSWGGAYGSTYRIDPREKLVVVFMIQQIPNRTDLPAKFPTLVYQALVGTSAW